MVRAKLSIDGRALKTLIGHISFQINLISISVLFFTFI